MRKTKMHKLFALRSRSFIAVLVAAVMLFSMLPVSVFAGEGISYLDSNGESQTCVDYTTLSDETTWESGWYYVESDTAISSRITVSGDVHLILGDGAELTASIGITVNDPNSLTIYAQSTGNDMGQLLINKNNRNDGEAAIGGSNKNATGSITINGGKITAIGSYYCAGIGGCQNKSGGTITINGGIIKATGGSNGAGIGGGEGGASGIITINGGNITATGGYYGSGIGAGSVGGCDTITINGGTIVATGNHYNPGIGGGSEYRDCGTIVINGGDITANGGTYSAGIGSCNKAKAPGNTIIINDGNIKATGGSSSAAIGGTSSSYAGTITIKGGTIEANGGSSAAGIGGGKSGTGGDISISGGSVTATGGDYGAGIGSGQNGAGGEINITDGSVTAVGGDYAAGIGSGESATVGNITNTADDVNATGGKDAEDIGSGVVICTVSYDGNGAHPMYGSNNNETAVSGAEFTLPVCKFKAPEGREFKAWSINGVEKAPGDTIIVTGNITIKAIWTNVSGTDYFINFDANGGSGTMSKSTVEAGEYTLPACSFTAPSNKAFKAWKVGNTEFDPGETITITDDVVIYAVWQNKYTVTFDKNGGSGSMSSVTVVSGEYTLPENSFLEPYKKVFLGWDVNGNKKAPGDTITVSENITIKAIWGDIYPITVGGVQIDASNASNITGENISGTVTYDHATQTLTLNNATVTAPYNVNLMKTIDISNGFSGTLTIRLVGNNSVTSFVPTGESLPTWIYTLYVYGCNLAFEGDGSLTIAAGDSTGWSYGIYCNDFTVGSECTIISASGKAMDEFGSYGFMYGIAVDGTVSADDSTIFVSTDSEGTSLNFINADNVRRHRYIKIVPAIDVTVSFDANGASGTMEEETVTYGSEYTLPECSFTAPSGMIFKAWSVNGEEKLPGDTLVLTEDITVTATWDDAPHECNIQPVEKINPTCTQTGKEAHYKCAECGKFFEDADGETEIDDIDAWGILETIDHTPSDWKSDSENHWKECTAENCNAEIEGTKAAHTSTGANEANCQREATCDVCGATYGDVGDHAPVNAWSKYDDGHWHACSTPGCSEMIGFEAHIDEDEDGICDTCSYEEEVTEDPEDPEIPENPEDSETPEDPESTEDEEAPESTEKPEESQKPADNKNPQTGDNGNIWLWSAAAFVIGAVAFGTLVRKNREDEEPATK